MKPWLWLALALLTGCGGGHSSSGTALPPQPQQHERTHSRSIRPLFNGTSDVVQTTKCSAHATSVTCAFTTAPAVGDTIVFLMGFYPASPTITAPSSLSHIDTCTRVEDWDRVVQSGDGNSFQFTSNVSEYMGVIAYDVVGADTTEPIDAHGCNATNGTTQTTPSLTPVTTGDLPIASFSNGNRNAFSGLTSGWTNDLNETSTYYNFGAHGPIATLSAVQASITLTGGSGTGGTALVLLQPSQTSSCTTYTLDGQQIWTAADWFTGDISSGSTCNGPQSTSVDPNSAAIISNLKSAAGGSFLFDVNGSNVTVEQMSEADTGTSSTLTFYTASGTNSCINGCNNDQNNDEPNLGGKRCTSSCNWTGPWESTFETPESDGGDCHYEVLETDKHLDYEDYTSTASTCPTPSPNMSVESASVYDYSKSLASQLTYWNLDGADGPIEGGFPLLGTQLPGEDESQTTINHALYISGGTSAKGFGGYVLPATSGPPCSSFCTHALPMGARLRLNESKLKNGSCDKNYLPSFPQSDKICHAMATYGIIWGDSNNNNVFGDNLAPKSDGTNPWSESDVIELYGGNSDGLGITIDDFDVLTLGTIH